jgi:hypothetical protein
MSIHIICLNDQTVVAHTVCDECDTILEERPAGPGEHAGTTLLIANWCRKCGEKHSWPIGTPVREVIGMSIGNPNAIAKVRIET